MNRQVKKLRKRYGKLSVVSEQTLKSRRYALVNCTCGQQKLVLVDALTSGRTKSCGASECKYGKRRKLVDKAYTPRGSWKIPRGILRRIWEATTRKEAPMTVAEAVRKFDIDNAQTVYSAMRTIRKCGGWDKYVEKLP